MHRAESVISRSPQRGFPTKIRVIAIFLLSLPAVCRATLGDSLPPSSREVSVRTIGAQRILVREHALPRGGVVREFAVPGGQVFAVTWRGRFMPALISLLGGYAERYRSLARSGRAGHSHLRIHTPQLVVDAVSHQRLRAGRAFLPEKLPQGISADALE